MMRTEGHWFKDEFGRTLMVRGVNLGDNSKVPHTPDGATWNRQGFFDHRNISWVGRTFLLEEAKVFEFEFRLGPDIKAPAEFFGPEYQYPDGYAVETTGGRYERVLDGQALICHPRADQSHHRIRIRRR